MNIITSAPVKCFDMWVVTARSPGGRPLLICHKGTVEEAIEKARWAEPDPA